MYQPPMQQELNTYLHITKVQNLTKHLLTNLYEDAKTSSPQTAIKTYKVAGIWS